MTHLHALIHRMADELDDFNHPFPHPLAAEARAALAQPEPEWPTPQPIPVSERLPGPGDCDAKGRCWIGRSEYTFPMGDTGSWGHADPEWCLEEPCEAANSTAVWLPAHALPVPADD